MEQTFFGQLYVCNAHIDFFNGQKKWDNYLFNVTFVQVDAYVALDLPNALKVLLLERSYKKNLTIFTYS